jgi:hypothetical protein
MTQSPTRPAPLTLDKLGPSFGAEVTGLDLSALSDEQVVIRQALVEQKVLFFRGQDAVRAEDGARPGARRRGVRPAPGAVGPRRGGAVLPQCTRERADVLVPGRVPLG